MAKGGSGKMLYFVLYVVLIVELLIISTERDELEEEEHKIRDKMLVSIAESYKAPLILAAVPKSLDFNVGSADSKEATVVLSAIGLVSEDEKKNVEFTVKVKGSPVPSGWPGELSSANADTNKAYYVLNESGTGKFIAKITNEGDFKFVAQCRVQRSVPDYLTERLKGQLMELIGDLKEGVSNQEEFTIRAKRQGGVKQAAGALVD
ncbi:MAG: hypothetical protein HRU80_12265 [Ignavibacteriales bacterium]|nr:hypothetical protein [Ignavibacteriaceae bacterium]MCK6612659.1 hypothetical protein [Ignavibacteriaceae bacterium]QOJ29605.1 MAG: hypothetical protein HRU80_12265 [Ignavibacteriales bacterium]